MSRLFDALKEATRFRENASAGEGVWKALGIDGAEAVPGLRQRHRVCYVARARTRSPRTPQ